MKSTKFTAPREFKVFEDNDESGDALLLSPECDPDGARYFAVQKGKDGTQWGVVLSDEQQQELVSDIVGHDATKAEFRVQMAQRAATILHSSNVFSGKVAPPASEVIALAEWLAFGDTEFAEALEALRLDAEDVDLEHDCA